MTKLIKKYIGSNQVGAEQIQLENDSALRGKDSAGQDLGILKIDADDKLQMLEIPHIPAGGAEPSQAVRRDEVVQAIEDAVTPIEERVTDVEDEIDAIEQEILNVKDDLANFPATDLTPYFKKDGSINMEGDIVFNTTPAVNRVTRLNFVSTTYAGDPASVKYVIKTGIFTGIEFVVSAHSGVTYTGSGLAGDFRQALFSALPIAGVVSVGAKSGAMFDVTTEGGVLVELTYDVRDANTDALIEADVAQTMAVMTEGSASEALYKIKGVGAGTVATDAVNKGQLDSAVGTLEQADANLQLQINSAIDGLKNWRGAFLVSEDIELISAVEGDTLASILPMGDDEAPALELADFQDGQLLLAKNGANSKLMKVYDDAGTLKVTFVDQTLVEGDSFIVKHDLIDSPADREGLAIYHFNGTNLNKLGDVDFALASQIVLGTWTTPVAGDTAVLPTDDVVTALNKLASSILKEKEDRALADLEFLKLDGTRPMAGNLSFELDALDAPQFQIKGILAGTDATDAVNKAQLDTAMQSVMASIAVFEIEALTLTAQNIADGYVGTVNNYIPKSLRLGVGERVNLYNGLDFTATEVAGVTRITFTGPSASAGENALEVGQVIYLGGVLKPAV